MMKEKGRLLMKLRKAGDIKERAGEQGQRVTCSSLRKRDREMILKYHSKEEIWIELFNQAQALWETESYSDVIKIYHSILNLQLPRNILLMIKINLALIYERTSQVEQAIDLYAEIINTSPNIAFIYNRLLMLLSHPEQSKSNLLSFLSLIQRRDPFNNKRSTKLSLQYQYNYAMILKIESKERARMVLEGMLQRIDSGSELEVMIKRELFVIYEELKLFSEARRMQKQLRLDGVKVIVGTQNTRYYQGLQDRSRRKYSQPKQKRFRFKSIDRQFPIIDTLPKLPPNRKEKMYQQNKENIPEQKNFDKESVSGNSGKSEITEEEIKLYQQLSGYKEPAVDLVDHPVVIITQPQPSARILPEPVSPLLPLSLQRIKTESNTHFQKDKSQQSLFETSGRFPFEILSPQSLSPFEGISIAMRRESKLSLFSNSRENYELLASEIESSIQPNRSNKKSLTISSYSPSSKSYQTLNTLDYALTLIENSNYKQAKSVLKRALSDGESDKTLIYNLLGDCYYHLQKYDTALSCWNKILAVANPEVLLKMERANRKLNRVSASIPILKQGLERFTKSSELFEAIGWIYLELSEIQRGLDYLEKARSLDSKSYSIKVKLAYAYFLKPSTSEQCKQALNSLSENIEQPDQTLKILLSHLLQTGHDPSQSLSFIKKLYQQDELNQNFLYLAGKACILTHDMRSAFEYLKRSISINPTKIQSYLLISTILCTYGYPKQALAILKQCLKINKNPQIYQLCGRISHTSGQFIEAIKYYKESYSFHHKNHLLNSIADCYHHLKKHNNAIIYYRRSLSSESSQPDVYKSLALLYQHVNQHSKSIKYFEKCVDEYQMSDYETLLGRIRSYILKKQYGQSILLLQQLLETHRTKEVYNGIGFCYYAIGTYSQAIESYVKALELGESPETNFNVGVCFNKLNDLENAGKYYLKCIEAEPNHSKSLYNYGVILHLRKDPDCVGYIQRSLRVEEKESIMRFDGNQLITNEESYLLLAEVCLDYGMVPKALKLCESVLSEFDLQKFYYFIIRGHLMLQDVKKAILKYEELLAKYPNSGDISRVEALFKEKQRA